jgi:hypothetical protein
MYVNCVKTLGLDELFHLEKFSAPQTRGYGAFINGRCFTAAISPSAADISRIRLDWHLPFNHNVLTAPSRQALRPN